MFKRILVPLDGSVRAERALPLAAQLARASGGSLLLVQVVHIPTEYGMYAAAPVAIAPAMVDADRVEAEGYLRHVKEREEVAGLTVETDVIIGLPAQDLLDEIAERQVDMVVMCSHGRTGLARWVLGSVAEQISRYAQVPVFVVRDQDSPFAVSAERDRPSRILVPLDGSPAAESVLEPAAQVALAFGAELHFVLVVMPMEAMRENMPEALVVDGAKAYLDKLTKRMIAEHPRLRAHWTVGINVDTAAAIIRIAENGEDTEGAGVAGGCDVIAMATHGRTGINRWAMGSITERVLHATKRSMLIIRALQGTESDS